MKTLILMSKNNNARRMIILADIADIRLSDSAVVQDHRCLWSGDHPLFDCAGDQAPIWASDLSIVM